jgi:hypothetical protein
VRGANMAIWQVSISLISDPKINYHDDVFVNALAVFSRTFPQVKSWSERNLQFGNLDSTCLEIFKTDEEIYDDISLRIDLRTLNMLELNEIYRFVQINGFELKCDRMVYKPTMKNLLYIIKNSNAYRFAKNPLNFLDEL